MPSFSFFFYCFLFFLPLISPFQLDEKKKIEIELAGQTFSLSLRPVGPGGERFWTNMYCDKRAIRVALNSLLSISQWVPLKNLPTIICGDQETCDLIKKLGLKGFYPKALVNQVKKTMPPSMPLGVPMMVRETIDKQVVTSGANYCIFDADLVWLRNPWKVMLGGDKVNGTELPEQIMEVQLLNANTLYVRPFGHLPDGGVVSTVLNNGLMCVRSTTHTRRFAEVFYKKMLEMAKWEPGFAQTSFSSAHEDHHLSLHPMNPKSISIGSTWTGKNDMGVLIQTLPVGAVVFSYEREVVGENTLLVHPVYGELDKTHAQIEKEKNLRVLGCWYLRNDWWEVVRGNATGLSLESLRLPNRLRKRVLKKVKRKRRVPPL